ncbi:unnamed protein product [Brassica oleracea var. botrytis]
MKICRSPPKAVKHLVCSGILLLSISVNDTQPLPINHPFGDDARFLEYVDHYFCGESSKTISGGRREVDKHRVESLKQLLSKEKDKDVKLMLPVIEQDWCDFHNISRSSFYHVSEMYKNI